jgi:murein DD-endopeptidase MepM/ murein hydrolase activator NlpD
VTAWFGRIILLCVTIFYAPDAKAIELNGTFSQGGLIVGRVAPGAHVLFKGRALRVSPDGLFAFGFGRKEKKKAILTVRYPDGSRQERELRIKAQRYKISKINGLPSRKVTPKALDIKRIRAEGGLISQARRRDTPDAYFRSQFIWPVTGRISGVFGSQRILNGKSRSPHSGVDIAAPKGTPIKAMADGLITMVHQNMFFTGKTLMIDHGHGVTSVYAHLSAIDIKEGALVKKGEVIGRVGATGRATAPHLHWGVSWFVTKLDPALVVGPMPKMPRMPKVPKKTKK